MTKTEQIFQLSTPYDNPFQGNQPRHLYVCSAGLLRSATAATIAAQMGINARNCGSHMEYALIPISVNLIFWAKKIIFVNMENYLRTLETFKGETDVLEIINHRAIVWDIEDDYRYMDPILVSMIQERIEKILI